MNRYLLDTNHLSAYIDGHANICKRVDDAIRTGDRHGICLPVLCEYRGGIRAGKRFQRNLARLQRTLKALRLWPADEDTAVAFAALFLELRSAGRMLSEFDLLIAAIARQYHAVLLTADKDFKPVTRLKIESWL